MCLTKVAVTVNGKGIGIGYKLIPFAAFNSVISADKFTICQFALKKKWSKQWRKSCYRGMEYDDSGNKVYPPGFHIFLRAQDAQKYSDDGFLVQVEYQNILAFGTNETGYGKYNAACVIANHMRIVKILKKIENEKVVKEYE